MTQTIPQHRLHCPACRATRPVREIGTTHVNGRRHILVQCADKACELVWAARSPGAHTRGRAA